MWGPILPGRVCGLERPTLTWNPAQAPHLQTDILAISEPVHPSHTSGLPLPGLQGPYSLCNWKAGGPEVFKFSPCCVAIDKWLNLSNLQILISVLGIIIEPAS